MERGGTHESPGESSAQWPTKQSPRSERLWSAEGGQEKNNNKTQQLKIQELISITLVLQQQLWSAASSEPWFPPRNASSIRSQACRFLLHRLLLLLLLLLLLSLSTCFPPTLLATLRVNEAPCWEEEEHARRWGGREEVGGAAQPAARQQQRAIVQQQQRHQRKLCKSLWNGWPWKGFQSR